MEILQKQILENGEEKLMSSQEDFRASRTALQEKGSVKKTNATCGHTCLEQYETLSQSTWWGKMFGELLVGTGGLVFDEVQADLEAEGYTVIPCVLPACGVNAPHRRERVWFVAVKDPDKDGWGSDKREEESCVGELWNVSSGDNEWVSSDNGEATAPNTNNARNTASRSGIVGDWTENIIERELAQPEFSGHSFTADTNDERSSAGLGSFSEADREISERDENAEPRNASKFSASNTESAREQRECEQEQREIQLNRRDSKDIRTSFEQFPTQPPICGGDDGLSRELDGITFPKWRSESIKAYGNAIVPAVAFEIFKVINEIDNFLNENSYLL